MRGDGAAERAAGGYHFTAMAISNRTVSLKPPHTASRSKSGYDMWHALPTLYQKSVHMPCCDMAAAGMQSERGEPPQAEAHASRPDGHVKWVRICSTVYVNADFCLHLKHIQ